jgi:hypothetical protein
MGKGHNHRWSGGAHQKVSSLNRLDQEHQLPKKSLCHVFLYKFELSLGKMIAISALMFGSAQITFEYFFDPNSF